MTGGALRIGQLAKRTGISVRALRYYDEVGLLRPSQRSEAGYRVYVGADVVRLQRIRSLQQLGFSLAEIRECLAQPGRSLLQALELQAARLIQQIALQQQLRGRLEVLMARLRATEEVSVEDLVQIMEVMARMDKYYTPEQQEYLRQRRETVGEARIHEAETTLWPQLMAEVRAAVNSGMDPASPEAQALATRWFSLVSEFTGGDPGVERSLANMYRQEKPQDVHPSMDLRMPEYMAFIGKARAAKQC